MRCEKYRMDDALSRIERFFGVQKQWPELYGQFQFDTIRGIIQDNVVELMPVCDDDGCVVIIARLRNWDTSFGL